MDANTNRPALIATPDGVRAVLRAISAEAINIRKTPYHWKRPDLMELVDCIPETRSRWMSTLVQCHDCGAVVPFNRLADWTDDDGAEHFDTCPDCAEAAGMVKCENCGAWVPGDRTCDVDGDTWCEDCTYEGASICDRCETYHANTYTVHVYDSAHGTIDDQYWCEGCIEDAAHWCDNCGEYYANYGDSDGETEVYDSDGGMSYVRVCPSCAEDLPRCAECGDLLNPNDYLTDSDGNPVCHDCYSSPALEDYGHTDGVDFYRLPDDPTPPALYLGIELETEAATDCNPEGLAKILVDTIGDDRICCKRDASLDFGCEIVTQPMSPAYHLGKSGPWGDVVRICTARGAQSHDGGRCGMHIHISRAWLDTDEKTTTLQRLIEGHVAEWVRTSPSGCASAVEIIALWTTAVRGPTPSAIFVLRTIGA